MLHVRTPWILTTTEQFVRRFAKIATRRGGKRRKWRKGTGRGGVARVGGPGALTRVRTAAGEGAKWRVSLRRR
jgi:hypothetical protein